MKPSKPTIIIVAFNRVKSFKRLLRSVALADYNNHCPNLVISIDYSEYCQSEIEAISKQFEWHGEKRIICHETNLGLKNHIFFCANLSQDYESVLILEDDLFVSPGYYNYCINALNTCQTNSHIAGIALYNNTYDEASALPFEAIKADGDFFLMQVPCSWGQIWTKQQWREFHDWYSNEYNKSNLKRLPKGIHEWSDHSWKKPFFLYLMEKQKFFLYPYTSYSNNLNELGTNVTDKNYKFLNQISLTSGIGRLKLAASAPKYDEAYNISPAYINKYNKVLRNYNYEIDFYGAKLHNYDDNQWLITTLKSLRYERSFGLSLKPIELNLIFNISGNSIFLTQKKFIVKNQVNKKLIDYHYPLPKWYYPFFQKSLISQAFAKSRHLFKRLIKSKRQY